MINQLIAADDLHWDEDEQRYILLSSDEINQIIASAHEQAFDEDETLDLVRWAEHARACSLALKNFLQGTIGVSKIINHEPHWYPKEIS